MKVLTVLALLVSVVALVLAIVALVRPAPGGEPDCSMYSPSTADYWACVDG